MTMTGSWIYTHGVPSGRWANIPRLGIDDAGGMPSAEWNNLSTGAGILLFPDGKWNQGGRFHLFSTSSSGQTAQVDVLLDPADPEYPASPTAWNLVYLRCIDYINHLLGGEVIVLEKFAKQWQTEVAARETAEAEALAAVEQPDPDDAVRRAAESAKERLNVIRTRRVEERVARESAASVEVGAPE